MSAAGEAYITGTDTDGSVVRSAHGIFAFKPHCRAFAARFFALQGSFLTAFVFLFHLLRRPGGHFRKGRGQLGISLCRLPGKSDLIILQGGDKAPFLVIEAVIDRGKDQTGIGFRGFFIRGCALLFFLISFLCGHGVLFDKSHLLLLGL